MSKILGILAGAGALTGDAFEVNELIGARLRRHRGTLMTSAIVLNELLAGMRPGEETPMQHLIDGLDVASVGVDEARLAARWRRVYRERGITLGRYDTLIAACAATHGVPLATANVRHFPMEDVTVEHWPSS